MKKNRTMLMPIKNRIHRNVFLYGISRNVKTYLIYFFNILTNYSIEKARFYKLLGYKLDLKNPKTFNEKIIWKKIHDRNPLLPVTADKYEVRSYVKEALGEEKAKEILIPLLYVTNKPETIPFNELPIPFIIKPNHSSGKYIIIKDKKYDKEEIIRTCRKWLKTPYGLEKLEWAYQPIKRKIIIEKLLLDEDSIPKDYKFFIIHGICRAILVISSRNSSNQSKVAVFYDREWNRLILPNRKHAGIDLDKPPTFQKMLFLAEKLGKAFDFVRVDLYTIGDKIYFGELTHYPMSGFIKISLEQDIEMGKYWKLKTNTYSQERLSG